MISYESFIYQVAYTFFNIKYPGLQTQSANSSLFGQKSNNFEQKVIYLITKDMTTELPLPNQPE